MEILHLSEKNYLVSRWSGGKTVQIAIAPGDAAYAERDFLWRISSASVDLPESEFTPLPDYNRWIATLDNQITLTHEGRKQILLKPLSPYRFDGGDGTRSAGQCTDFNLMLRKGACDGSLRALRLRAGMQKTLTLDIAGFWIDQTLTKQKAQNWRQ